MDCKGNTARRKLTAILLTIVIATLLSPVAMAQENEVPAPALYFIGHASIMLRTSDGTVIYIDPSYEGDYTVPADIILITHGHGDHNHPELCTQNEGCEVITWAEALVDGVYNVFEIGGVTIQPVPAANANHPIETSVGYVVTFDDIVFYHAGDTSLLESMSDLKALAIDYAMYPVDGRYNMDSKEATVVATMVGAKHSIPMHFVDLTQIDALKADFSPENSLYLNYGDTIQLEK